MEKERIHYGGREYFYFQLITKLQYICSKLAKSGTTIFCKFTGPLEKIRNIYREILLLIVDIFLLKLPPAKGLFARAKLEGLYVT